MEMCSGKKGVSHEEIIFDRGSCPLCAANDEIKSLEDRIRQLEDDLI